MQRASLLQSTHPSWTHSYNRCQPSRRPRRIIWCLRKGTYSWICTERRCALPCIWSHPPRHGPRWSHSLTLPRAWAPFRGGSLGRLFRWFSQTTPQKNHIHVSCYQPCCQSRFCSCWERKSWHAEIRVGQPEPRSRLAFLPSQTCVPWKVILVRGRRRGGKGRVPSHVIRSSVKSVHFCLSCVLQLLFTSMG